MDVLNCGAGDCLPGASGGGASLVPVVEVSPWCRWLPTWCQWWRCLPGAGGCLPGASGGGASMVPVAAYLVPVVEVPPWWLVYLDHSGRAVAYIRPGTQAGTHANSSARRAVSLLNQSCRVRLIDAITLIINYLGAPLGFAFTELFVG